jgi:hypothetical protein
VASAHNDGLTVHLCVSGCVDAVYVAVSWWSVKWEAQSNMDARTAANDDDGHVEGRAAATCCPVL